MECILTQTQTGRGGGAYLLSCFDSKNYHYLLVQHLEGDDLGEDEDEQQ